MNGIGLFVYAGGTADPMKAALLASPGSGEPVFEAIIEGDAQEQIDEARQFLRSKKSRSLLTVHLSPETDIAQMLDRGAALADAVSHADRRSRKLVQLMRENRHRVLLIECRMAESYPGIAAQAIESRTGLDLPSLRAFAEPVAPVADILQAVARLATYEHADLRRSAAELEASALTVFPQSGNRSLTERLVNGADETENHDAAAENILISAQLFKIQADLQVALERGDKLEEQLELEKKEVAAVRAVSERKDRRIRQLNDEVAANNAELVRFRADRATLEAALAAIRSSTSWRISAPVRWARFAFHPLQPRR